MANNWFNYVVSFSDHVCKTGITSKPFYRLQDFMQEARRNNKRVVGFVMTAPAESKAHALRVESSLCKKYEQYSIEGHREWFFDDMEWCRPSKKKALTSDAMCRCIGYDLEDIWLREHVRQWRKMREQRDDFRPMRELAEQLGKDGDRISASRATAMFAGQCR